MDENTNVPDPTAPQPDNAPTVEQTTPASPEQTPAVRPAPEQPATAQPEPEQPAAPQGAPAQPAAQQPVQAASSYDAQYAVQPVLTPTSQPDPTPTMQPAPAAPASPTPALICGILAIVLCGIPIVGIILGIVAIVQAGKYYKAGGTEGTAKGGRICGIVGIVLSAIIIVASCVLAVFALNELRDHDTTETALTYSSEREATSSSAADANEADQAVYDAVDPFLLQIKEQDPAMVATVANIMETSFNEALREADLDITLADCGVDATELATAMMDGFDYTPFYVSTEGNATEANYKVTVRSIIDVCDVFYEKMMDVSLDLGAGSMTEKEAYTLIGDALMSAVQSSAPEADNIWDVDLTKSGESWTLDMESWNDELDFFFAFD